MVRPRRGSSMLEICCGVRPGFSAVRVVDVIAEPGTNPPVVTLAGPVGGMGQELEPRAGEGRETGSQGVAVGGRALGGAQCAGRPPAGIAVFPAGGEDLVVHARNA